MSFPELASIVCGISTHLRYYRWMSNHQTPLTEVRGRFAVIGVFLMMELLSIVAKISFSMKNEL